MNHDLDDLDGVLRTMMRTAVAETSKSPAMEEWRDVNDRLAALPVLSTVQVGDVIVARHADTKTSAACAQRGGQTSGRIEPGSVWGVSGSFDVDVIVAGTWVHVGYGTDFRPTQRFVAALDRGVAQSAWVPDGDGSLYAFVLPSQASKLTVDVAGAVGGSGASGMVRPLL